MRAGGDLDIKTLLQRLQPAQRHAEAGVALAGRDGLQQLVGRARVVDQLDVEIVLFEEALIDRHRDRRQADRTGIPGQFQLARRPREGWSIRRGPADRKLREIDLRCRAQRQCLRPIPAKRRRNRCRSAGLQQPPPVEHRGCPTLFVHHYLPREMLRGGRRRMASAHPSCGVRQSIIRQDGGLHRMNSCTNDAGERTSRQ